ncbi:MAG: OsmC family protein [Clostridiaceae bacterium]|jgi:uncharacterized OsmC-like protein|nr:OsmC family protein [Clostridiaceae bacterium]
MADARIRVEANSATLPKTFIRSGKFEWIIDEPESFGGQSQGPSPVETLLAAIASCIVAAGHWIAGEMGIVIHNIRIAVEGTIDSDKFFGKVTSKRAGFSNIELSISLDTEASDDLIKKWLDQTLDRCPVIDNLLKPVHITTQISY